MPTRGGTAAKYGIRYEDRWSALCLMRVLSEQASSIYLEPPGPEYEGFEFALATPDGVEYHQAKRQKTGEGRWRLEDLADAGVLRSFFERLHDENSSCTFVSAHAAGELDELADRARKADSAEEFTARHLDSKTWRSHFAKLVGLWEADEEWSWRALKRIFVRTIDEQTLIERLDLEAQMRLAGPAESAAAVLIEVVRKEINRRLTADDLWGLLEERAELGPNPLFSQELGAVALAAANERFGRSRQRDRIGGRLIPREETEAVRKAMEQRRVVFIQGAAGMGKSEVLSGLLAGLEEDGSPHLVMRLDRLKGATTAAQVGEQLGLTAPPPVVLAAVAAGSPSFLLVDQLDAISTTSGRHPEFLEAVDEMLRLALLEPQMRIVVACRSFDASHDSRLRQIVAADDPGATVTVGPLSEPVVRQTLEDLQIDPAALDQELIELCSVPLHLYLMSQISARDPASVRRLKTLNDLFDAYWRDKQEALLAALERDPQWTEVIDALVDHMSDEPSLEAPRTIVDGPRRDVDAMLSASVLVEEEGRIAFFHETFFDYAFARRFSARGRTLRQLLEGDQLLFRRAQVRQILARGRDGAPQRYEEDLEFLLGEPLVRFHLKDLVLAWLQTVDAPREHEWRVLEGLLDGGSDALAKRAWNTLSTPAWFEFLDDRGILAAWLADDARRERTLQVLASSGPESGDRVARLLGDEGPEEVDADTELEAVIRGGNLVGSRELFEVLLSKLEDGSDLGRRDFWYLAHELPDKRPDWACELLGTYLRGRMRAGELLLVQSGEGLFPNTRMVRQGLHLRDFIEAAATGAPRSFVEEVLPMMFEIVELTGERESGPDGLRSDAIWGYRNAGETFGELEEDLFIGAEQAVRGLAQQDPGRFRGLLEEQAETEYESVACLLYTGMAAAPTAFGETAVNFLTVDPRRFRVGYNDAYHWTARTLLASIFPGLPGPARARLEASVLAYYTPWERSVQSRGRQHGLAQLELLGGIAEADRTPAVRRRIGELERKFGDAERLAPQGVRSGVVGSPIAENDARKMNDANWRRAMERYASDERDRGDDFLKGGPLQLSGVLETLSAEDPIRFAHLAETLPDETNTAYFDAILRGVAKSEDPLPLTDAEALVRRCHRIEGRPCGQWIGQPLRAHVGGDISAGIVEILSWYATEGDGTSRVDIDDEDIDRRLLSRGLNSVRGGMAYELARLIHARGSRIVELRPALESLCDDESTAVRAMAAEAVLAVAAHDPGYGLDLFLRLTDSDDALLATRFVRQFLVHLGAREFTKLAPLIERMVDSPLRAVREEGAAQAALAALSESSAQPLADACLDGAPELRLGATRVFAQNLHTRYRPLCEERLGPRFEDGDKEVRKAAAEAIRQTSGADLSASADLIEEFLGSRAFPENLESVLFAFEDAGSTSAALVLDACERVLEMLESPDDVTRRAARVAHQVSDLLLRAYVDAIGPDEKARALDVIDHALEMDAYGTHRALLDHDRG